MNSRSRKKQCRSNCELQSIKYHNLTQNDLNRDADNSYRAKLQLKDFNIGKYNELYKYSTNQYGGVIRATRYVKNLQDWVIDYEEKEMFVNEVKAWLNCREKK